MSQKTIRVVEDEAAIRDMLKFTLTSSGFWVEEADNAEQGMRIALEKKPDLILLDWMLPGISGVTMAQKLRQNGATENMPIIMLTARGEEEAQVQGFESGVDDYVVKPFSPRAVSIIIGMFSVAPFWRNFCAMVTPEIPGNIQSSKIRSGFFSSAMRIPCSALSASSTQNPDEVKVNFNISRIAASSSTTRIVFWLKRALLN
ncbi:hypothetical protein THIOSC15_510003 [uncultured Thiomicrorhabdus sp.]